MLENGPGRDGRRGDGSLQFGPAFHSLRRLTRAGSLRTALARDDGYQRAPERGLDKAQLYAAGVADGADAIPALQLTLAAPDVWRDQWKGLP